MHIAICGEVIFLLVSYSTEPSKFTFSAFANYKYRQTETQAITSMTTSKKSYRFRRSWEPTPIGIISIAI